jgi:hypothetical protein
MNKSFEDDDPDVRFNKFVNAANASSAAADVRDAAARDQAAQVKAAQDQAAQVKAARDQAARDKAARDKAARNAELVPNCEEIRKTYFYESQSPEIQLIINNFIHKPMPFSVPFGGDYERAAKAAADWQRSKRGGYKSKLKSKKSRYNKKSKTNKRRRSRSRRSRT